MKIYTLIFLISLSACGFKPLNQLSEKKNFFINNIEINGEKRISYIVKNEILLNSSTKSENKINIKLNIKKKKQIKEKNIAGKISSYTITLNADLIVEDKKNLKKNKKKLLKIISL